MKNVPSFNEVLFLEKLQRLLSAGDFTSTYKFAVLIALTELSAEAPPQSAELTHAFITRQLAEKVIRLYWPHVRPFVPDRDRNPRVLRQNQQGQAAIISWIHGFQERTLGGRIPPTHLDGLMRAHAGGYERLLRDVEWKLIEMPLPRLQEINRETDDFIYSISWAKADVEPYGGRLKPIIRNYQAGQRTSFDNRILMNPGVVATMRRLSGIIRDLVEARWVLKVEQIDPDLRRDHSLRDHLFGVDRRSLAPVRSHLVELQRGTCFYCRSKSRALHVDHFLPHALTRVDFIENLVAACSRCNGAKSVHLAAEHHVERWLGRVSPGESSADMLGQVATDSGWPTGLCPSLSLARLIYGQHPGKARLWRDDGNFVPWTKEALLARIDGTLGDADCASPWSGGAS